MWTRRRKRSDDGQTKKLNARCVARGDLHAKHYHVDSNQTMSPVVRTPSLRLDPPCHITTIRARASVAPVDANAHSATVVYKHTRRRVQSHILLAHEQPRWTRRQDTRQLPCRE